MEKQRPGHPRRQDPAYLGFGLHWWVRAFIVLGLDDGAVRVEVCVRTSPHTTAPRPRPAPPPCTTADVINADTGQHHHLLFPDSCSRFRPWKLLLGYRVTTAPTVGFNHR